MWVEVTLAALRLLIFLLISDLLKEKTKMYYRCPKFAGGLCPCPCSMHSIMSCQAGSGSQEDAGMLGSGNAQGTAPQTLSHLN